MEELTHIDEKGRAVMVDVSDKKIQKREAVACGEITLQPGTIELIRSNALKKGDVLAVARIAGIQAAKATSSLIPLCHPLQLTNVRINTDIKDFGIKVTCTVSYAGTNTCTTGGKNKIVTFILCF